MKEWERHSPVDSIFRSLKTWHTETGLTESVACLKFFSSKLPCNGDKAFYSMICFFINMLYKWYSKSNIRVFVISIALIRQPTLEKVDCILISEFCRSNVFKSDHLKYGAWNEMLLTGPLIRNNFFGERGIIFVD